MVDQSPLPPIHVQVIPIEVFEPAPDEGSRVMRGPRDQVRKLTEAQMAVAFNVTEKLAGEAAAMLGRLRCQPGAGRPLRHGGRVRPRLQHRAPGIRGGRQGRRQLARQADLEPR